eukprot:520140_1
MLSSTSQDHLGLRNDKNIKKLLKKVGENYPLPETVELSSKLIKINRKEKEQTRVLLLTTKAIYNIKPKKYTQCQRRIMIAAVASITTSIKSAEFTINVPTEYDYRFRAYNQPQKNEIICALCKLYGILTGLKLNVHKIAQSTTIEHTVTKVEAQLSTQQEKYRRRQKLTACDDMMYEPRKYTDEDIEYDRMEFASDKGGDSTDRDDEKEKEKEIICNKSSVSYYHNDYVSKINNS